MDQAVGIRGTLVDFVGEPGGDAGSEPSLRWLDDGLLVIVHGKIVARGSYAELSPSYPKLAIHPYGSQLIMPGFIDGHTHYPQLEMVASFGHTLLEWLDHYTYPTEAKFADRSYAEKVAALFIRELLRHGTTTALVFATSHSTAVDALFQEAKLQGMRLIAGRVLMDRNAPADLLDKPGQAYEESARLLQKWHGKERLLYAVTPRFAPSCSEDELRAAAQLQQDYPDVYLQTHLAENKAELAWVAQLFPSRSSYLDVYDHFGLVGARSVFAHGIYLEDADWRLLQQKGGSLCHCPSSNMFLGSGLFSWQRARREKIPLSLGTDLGAGLSFSMLASLADAYKVAALSGMALDPALAFYQLTLGAARALKLDHVLGNFAVGKEADILVIDPAVSPLQRRRLEVHNSPLDQLFTLMMLGDDRNIKGTYLAGTLVR